MSHLPKNDPRAKIKALERALTEDLCATSDADFLKDFSDDGLDISEVANSMRTSALDLVMQVRRKKLALAKAGSKSQAFSNTDVHARPSVESIKRLLGDLFAAKPALAIAFRQGKSQSDTDWISLWDDLVEIGEIPRNDDES
jgi:hypothetical protein